MQKREKVIIVASIILKGFVVAVIFHYIAGMYLGKEFPLNTFLFIPDDKFMDYFNSINIVTDLNPYFSEKIVGCAAYFPFTYSLLYFFSLVGKRGSFTIYSAAFIGYFIYYCRSNILHNIQLDTSENKREYANYIFIFSLLSFPFLFVLDRGNIESIVFVLLTLFLSSYQHKHYNYSAIFLALASALKAYPFLFAVLFLVDNQKKYIWHAAILTIAVSIISIFTFQNGLIANIQGLMQQLKLFNNIYIVGSAGLEFNSSLFGMIKAILIKVHMSNTLDKFIKIYPFLAFSLIIYIVWYIIKVEKQLWKRIALLTFSIILFPQVSGEYKLLHVFLPMFLFINQSENQKNSDFKDRTIWYCRFFALLLIPKPHFYNISTIIDPIILMVMMILIMQEGYKIQKMQLLKNNNTMEISIPIFNRFLTFFEVGKFTKFVLVGLLGSVINLLIFYIITDMLRVNYNIGAICSFIVSVTNNYLLNHYWTFCEENIGVRYNLAYYCKYVAANIISLLVNILALNLFIIIFNPEIRVVGQLFGIGCGSIFTFFSAKKFVFKKEYVYEKLCNVNWRNRLFR